MEDFDPATAGEHPLDVTRRHATVLSVCNTACGSRTTCAAWWLLHPKGRRPQGVIAGRIYQPDPPSTGEARAVGPPRKPVLCSPLATSPPARWSLVTPSSSPANGITTGYRAAQHNGPDQRTAALTAEARPTPVDPVTAARVANERKRRLDKREVAQVLQMSAERDEAGSRTTRPPSSSTTPPHNKQQPGE